MDSESGGGGTYWGEEAEQEMSGRPGREGISAADTGRDMDQNSEPEGADNGMSVDAGMGGFNSYDSASSISTSVDDSGSGEGSGGGDRTTAERGSTRGRSRGEG